MTTFKQLQEELRTLGYSLQLMTKADREKEKWFLKATGQTFAKYVTRPIGSSGSTNYFGDLARVEKYIKDVKWIREVQGVH